MMIRCRRHPRYLVRREPRSDCSTCWFLWRVWLGWDSAHVVNPSDFQCRFDDV